VDFRQKQGGEGNGKPFPSSYWGRQFEDILGMGVATKNLAAEGLPLARSTYADAQHAEDCNRHHCQAHRYHAASMDPADEPQMKAR
jgi:hypothetical protein